MAALLVSSITVAAVCLVPLYGHHQQHHTQELLYEAQARAKSVEYFLRHAREVAFQISSRSRMRQLLDRYNQGQLSLDELRADCGPKLADALHVSQDVLGALRLDAAGEPVLRAGLDLHAQAERYLPGPMDHPRVLGPTVVSSRLGLLVASPILERDGRRVGTDLVLFDDSGLEDLVHGRGETGPGGQFEVAVELLYREDSTVVAVLPILRGQTVQPGCWRLDADDPLARSALRVRGWAPQLQREQIDGDGVLLASCAVGDSPMVVCIRADAGLIFRPVFRQVAVVAGVILGVLAAGVLGLLLLLRPLAGRMVLHASELESEVRSKAASLREELARRIRTERELKEAKRTAEQASDFKSDFIANVSHELRTPLTAILGYAELLAGGEAEGADARSYAKTIRDSGQYLMEVLNDVLDVSKIEAGRLEIRLGEVRVGDLVEEVLSLHSAKAQQKGLELSVAYETDLPERIRTDPVRVRQILMNLLGNAVKFTESGSVRLSVAATALDQDRPMIRFSVTDTGPGIPPERLESVFERFNQGEGKTGSAGSGTGLGLTISRRLAELLGGNLRVCSVPGEGSTFTVLIDPGPVLGVAKLSAEELSHRCCHGRSMPQADQLPRDLDARVLVADDVAANRTLIQALLQKAGCTVELAENGAEAYERTLRAQREGRPFDAVFLDMHMPVMDGYEAAARLRSSHYYGPVIALTAHAMAGDREACLSAGCTDYLAKPIDRAQLLGMLASLLPQCRPTGV